MFGYVKLTKNAGQDKYKYIGYNIGFNSPSEFSLPDCSMGKYVTTFEINMSSYVHIDIIENTENTLNIGVGPTEGLVDTILTAGTQY